MGEHWRALARQWPERLAAQLVWALLLATGLVGLGDVFLHPGTRPVATWSHQGMAPGLLSLGLLLPALVWQAKAPEAEAEPSYPAAEPAPVGWSQEAALLSAVGDAVSRFLDQEKVLDAALRLLLEFLRAPAAAIWLAREGQQGLTLHRSLPEDLAPSHANLAVGRCVCGRCAQLGRTLIIADLVTEPEDADCLCACEGMRSVLAVPMRSKGLTMGVICFASREPNAFASRNPELLAAVGERIATAVENAWLFAEANRRAVYLEAASAIGRRVTALTDLDTLMSDVVSLLRGRFGYYQTHILLVDDDGKHLVLKEASGPASGLLKQRGVRLRVGKEGITGRVAQTGQAVLCNDVHKEPLYHPSELLPETRSELAMPMRLGKRIVGVLDVQSDRPDAFDQQDMSIMQIIGTQVAIAIENARLFREATDRYEALIALHKTSLDMISQLDVQQLLEALLYRGARMLSAHSTCLYLYDRESGLIRNVANYNTWRDLTGVAVPMGDGVIGRVVQTGRPLTVNDYLTWTGRSSLFPDTSATAVMGAPLHWQDQILGGIVAFREPPCQPFNDDDLWLLSLFADSAVSAIKNAELYTQARQLSETLERSVEERTRQLSEAKEELAARARELQSLLARTVSIQEEERRRIALEMHDSVIQLVAAARYELQAARVSAGPDLASSADSRLTDARKLLSEAEREIRRAIHNLTPSTLDSMDMVGALTERAASFQRLTGIRCDLTVRGRPEPQVADAEVACFRVVQEALNNIAKHSGATAVSIALDYQPQVLEVTVKDDGRGFDVKAWSSGQHDDHLGLLSMRERAESLGGSVHIWSEPGRGTQVVLRLPATWSIQHGADRDA